MSWEWANRIGNMRQFGRRYRRWNYDRATLLQKTRRYLALRALRAWRRAAPYRRGQRTGRNRAGQIWALQEMDLPNDLIRDIVARVARGPQPRRYRRAINL